MVPLDMDPGRNMSSENLKFWTTLIANLGVMLGLTFLVLEIQQNSGIAATQARMDFASAWRDIDSTRQDESFAELLAKTYDDPGALSVVDATRLDAYYWGILDQMLSAKVADSTGVRLGAFEDTAYHAAKIYFANDFAQVWWRHVRLGFLGSTNQDFLQVMDEAIDRVQQSEYTNPNQNVVNELAAGGAALKK